MKALAALLAAMCVTLTVGVLAYVEVINLPGQWRTTLGFQDEVPNPPCRLGLYRRDPASPPPAPGRWRFEPEPPKAPVEAGATAIGPVIYVVGGNRPGNMHRVMRFDTRTDRWSEPAQLPFALNHVAAAAYGGKVYVAGGFDGGDVETDRFLEYDPATDRWSQMPPMKRARGGAAAAVVGDKLYVIDGAPQPYGIEDPEPPYALLEAFDFRTRTWSTLAPPPAAVHHFGAAVVDGKIYIAGGRVDHESSSNVFASYDPATDRWTRLGSLPEGKISSMGVVSAGGKLVIFGGDDEVGWEDGGGFVSPTAWAYDPETRRWTRLPDLRVERHAFGAAAAGGRIYAIAGSICPGLKPGGAVATHTVESLRIPVRSRSAAGSP